MSPLSPIGSLRGPGGRFNIGSDLAAAGFQEWPALYVAEDFETAYRERFQIPRTALVDGLTPQELALEQADSFTDVRLKGTVGFVFDVGNRAALEPFARIIARFKMPPNARTLARHLGLTADAVDLIRSATKLQRIVLETNWRMWPVQFDLPSQSQILGRFLLEAGFEAIKYPSSKNGGMCIAALPRNFTGDSYIEIDGPHPDEVRHSRLDAETAQALSQP